MKWDEFVKFRTPEIPGHIETDVECPMCGKHIYLDCTVALATYPANYCYVCTCGWHEVSPVKWTSGMSSEKGAKYNELF